MTELRMTLATQLVLRALMAKPADDQYGADIAGRAGLPGGTIYPILARLEQIGWLESHWETIDPSVAGRPRRRYYALSRDGAEKVPEALRAVERRTKSHWVNPEAQGGLA